LRVPIAIAMFLAGAIGYIMQAGLDPYWQAFLNSQAFARFASYDLSVIPLFILMGHFATQGGISRRRCSSFAAARHGRLSQGGWRWQRCWPVRGVWCHLRVVSCHSGHDHRRSPCRR
jgi:hypothetical protein